MMASKPKFNVSFDFKPFSIKQMQVLSWWMSSAYSDKETIIADGSVRAGKTVVMSLGYVIWSMSEFNGHNFGMAGKTIGSLRRNVIRPLVSMLSASGYSVKDNRSENRLDITKGNTTNFYFLFGGKDESSQDLVQGITTAGFFFDEVVLMPQSFVNQATARASDTGAKFWFNGNPEGPYHWFKQEWIDNLAKHHAIRIHFMMKDNPSLSLATRERYERMYSGVFYQRYILGQWSVSEGVIYDNFDQDRMVVDLPDNISFDEEWVSADYGTQNATVFKRWSRYKGIWYNTDEYYYSGRDTAKQKTDSQFREDLEEFYERNHLERKHVKMILDPAAASFRAELRQCGFRVVPARNDVLNGIRAQMSAMNEGKIKWSSKAVNTFKEINSYIWDKKAADKGEDKPVKEHDHAMDADRYFVYTVLSTRTKIGW